MKLVGIEKTTDLFKTTQNTGYQARAQAAWQINSSWSLYKSGKLINHARSEITSKAMFRPN